MANKKNNPKQYFGPEQENAVLRYVSASTQEEKSRIFREELKEPLNRLVESIIRTYNFHRKGISFEELHYDTLSHLMEKADKFSPKMNRKAYSYYGTIVKNYLMNLQNDDQKKRQRGMQYEDVDYSIENDEEYSYELEEDGYSLNDFLKKISSEIQKEVDDSENKKIKKKLTENEKKVGLAVIDILDNWEEAFNEMEGKKKFNKMSILASIREMTGLTTKDIRVAMKRFKSLYALIKRESISKGYL